MLVATNNILSDKPVVCGCVNSSTHCYQLVLNNILHWAHKKVHIQLSVCTVYGTGWQSLLAIVILSCVVSIIDESTNHVIPASTRNDHERKCFWYASRYVACSLGQPWQMQLT